MGFIRAKKWPGVGLSKVRGLFCCAGLKGKACDDAACIFLLRGRAGLGQYWPSISVTAGRGVMKKSRLRRGIGGTFHAGF